MIKIGISGATGKIGSLICDIVKHDHRFDLVSIMASPQNPFIGKEIYPGLVLHSSCDLLCEQVDVVVDFSHPMALPSLLTAALKRKPHLVIGTTGLPESTMSDIQALSSELPILLTSNTSIGISVMESLVEMVSKQLGDHFDIEIHEKHHRYKIDSPSGTAITLGKASARGRGVAFEDYACYSRSGLTGKRPLGQIGFSVERGGGIMGEHSVSFYSDDESLTIQHKAFSKKGFARGALEAAFWIYKKTPGFYTMRDVFGI